MLGTKGARAAYQAQGWNLYLHHRLSCPFASKWSGQAGGRCEARQDLQAPEPGMTDPEPMSEAEFRAAMDDLTAYLACRECATGDDAVISRHLRDGHEAAES